MPTPIDESHPAPRSCGCGNGACAPSEPRASVRVDAEPCNLPAQAQYCCAPPTGSLSRRAFLAAAGVGAGGVLSGCAAPMRAIAGPFESVDLGEFPIPADKKFDPAWVRCLFERGAPAVYRHSKGELYFIGMPIGGICTGQLYLGGDGKLWHWDIFNLPASDNWRSSQGPHYANPVRPSSPIEQGFALRVQIGDKHVTRPLDVTGFPQINFKGQYPIGFVEYRDPALPVEVDLEAFSPFIPGNADDSGLPCVILNYTVKNTSKEQVEISLAGWTQNPSCLQSGASECIRLANDVLLDHRGVRLICSTFVTPPFNSSQHRLEDGECESDADSSSRPDILFEDFEKPTYEGWAVTGTAFGDGSCIVKERPAYMGELNAQGERTVNTHQTRKGEDVGKADTHIGTLTSREFTIERNFIRFRIGGGNHPAQTCVNLLIDGAVLRTATGTNNNRMRFESFDVKEFAGRTAQIQIVDGWTGGWGQVGVDEIVFADTMRKESTRLKERQDYGSLAIAIPKSNHASESFGGRPDIPPSRPMEETFLPGTCESSTPPEWLAELAEKAPKDGSEPQSGQSCAFQDDAPIYGSVRASAKLNPGESHTFTFIVAWHFDGLWWDSLSFLAEHRSLRRHYGTRFKNAQEVVDYVLANFDRLTSQTRLWHKTWYDSTLPHWFLDRTFATVSTLATATCYRFNNGRFYGWEGTYCCAGTCTHVWQYAQAIARTFPQLERATREMIDFGASFHDDTGLIDYRGEAAKELAVDGQAGTILRAYREHQMSADDAFLKKIYPRVRKALELLIARDKDADGILDDAQYNTLDTTWYGAIPWISSLYLAAVRAGEAMALEMDDAEFAAKCRAIAESGAKRMVEVMFNGESFVHRVDPAHPETNSTGNGIHTDQLLGQSWAHQLDLPRIVPLEPSRSALRAIYRYCFTPDVGTYRARIERTIKGGRWYAMPGEGGVLMCTWPHGGIDSAAGKSGDAWAAVYFNECWTGYEYQLAAHMIREGLVEEGLAIVRMLHDRHHPSKRNPYNEVECSSHYARAMAGFGVYLAALGYQHHGPKGHLAFAPKLSPENFKAAFTAAEGWGTFEQTRAIGEQRCQIKLAYGRLRLASLGLEVAKGVRVGSIKLEQGSAEVPGRFEQVGSCVKIELYPLLTLSAGETLKIALR